VIARVGGEEFAMLLPEVTDERAASVAEELRELIATSRFVFEATSIPVTCSFGVAQWADAHRTPADIVKAADERLYEAKRSGRNRVCR
jgi:two-component system, cell cycle response regulator